MSTNQDSPVSPLSGQPFNLHAPVNNVSRHGSSPTSPAPVRKSRVALACKRCKRRKQRCDGSHPVCKSCSKADTPCIYEKNIRPQYPGGKSLYINALEERIAFLEARLPAYAEDHFADVVFTAPPVDDAPSNEQFRERLDSSSSHRESLSEDPEGENPNSIIDGVAYLSLCASGTTDTAPEPFYLGSSSGATIARMIQKSIFRNSSSHAVAQNIQPIHDRQPAFAKTSLSAAALSVLQEEPATDFPDREVARVLFDVFFDRMHTRWPILDRKAYSALFENQYDRGALSIMQRSIMHLIYAIAARFLQLTRKPCGVDPEKHLLAAIEPMDYILEQHNLATVQFLLLLAVHGQRSPYGAGAWSQVRYAVSLCIELGLHRERKVYSQQNARDLEIRRRAFWACYGLDRATSIVLGRAFAIADRDINVALPNPSVDFWDLTHKEPPAAAHQTPFSNIEPFIHIIKLERIQSRTHRTVFRVDKDVLSGTIEEKTRMEQKMMQIRSELDNWIQTVPKPPVGFHKITWLYDPDSASHDSQDFFNLQYHKNILMLFTVLLPSLLPTDHRFVTSARSAACVCTAYKRLNQSKTLTYTMISLHSCFVAGLTLVYCVWRDRSLFGYEVFEATQACSQSLTIFGEKWAGAVKYRDIFDALSGSLFKTLVNPMGLSKGSGLSMAEPMFPPSLDSSLDRGTSRGPDVTRSAQQNTEMQEPDMRHLMSDAVREAFMEVDEEAPGGWQGWRMWNEMLGEGGCAGSNSVPCVSSGFRHEQPVIWSGSALDDQGLSDVTMMQSDRYGMMETHGWNLETA